jgi:hypothetical protein
MMDATNAITVGATKSFGDGSLHRVVNIHGNRHDVVRSMKRNDMMSADQIDFVIPIMNSVSSNHPELHDDWKVKTYHDGSVSVSADDVFTATYDIKDTIVYLDVSGSKTAVGRNKVSKKINDALSSHGLMDNDEIMAQIRKMQGL